MTRFSTASGIKSGSRSYVSAWKIDPGMGVIGPRAALSRATPAVIGGLDRR